MQEIKFAFHIHTCYSKDSCIKPKDIVSYCRKNDIGLVAICDHDEIRGAIECQKLADGNPVVIVSEEVKTMEGEIIGLFLKRRIEPKQALEETIGQIKTQGGLVCLPHPGETFRRSAISKKNVEKFINNIDIVEIFNARTLLLRDNFWAEKLARSNNKAVIVGSDAHFLIEIGNAINHINEIGNRDNFIKMTKKAKFYKHTTGMMPQMLSLAIRYYRNVFK